MRRTRLRRKIDLDNGVSVSPSMLFINNNQTPPSNSMRRRSMGTPSLASIPNTPNYVESPNRTLNETFSPEPEEKVFSIRTLVDSVKKHKRHTSSSVQTVTETTAFDTPRVTRATLNSARKTRSSIKKTKDSPVFDNLKRIVQNSPTAAFFQSIEQVANVVPGDTKVIKSIRKQKRRSSTINGTLASEKKNVKFHSPANMEMSTFDIDVKMQSDRKVLKRLRSLSNAETEKEKEAATKPLTPEKAGKTKTPRSRKKMPNFMEIHQRQFDRMESITEHAARKVERAKNLIRSPMGISKTEVTIINEPETMIVPKEESISESEVVSERVSNVWQESDVKEEPKTEKVEELEPDLAPEPGALSVVDPEILQKPEQLNVQSGPILNISELLEVEELDHISLPSGSTSISTSPIVEKSNYQLISKSDLNHIAENEQPRVSPLLGRSPFAVEIQQSFSFVPKSPARSIRPIAISKIPAKIKTVDKNQTLPLIRSKVSRHELNSTKIPQPKFNSSVLTTSNSNATSNLNTSNVFVFKANKTTTKKPIVPVPTVPKVKPNPLKRTKSMMAEKPKPSGPVRPAKENRVEKAKPPGPLCPTKEIRVDKVKERQQKNMSLYKARPDPEVKMRTPSKNIIAVRTNKRFELQMKFRQMNAKN